MIKSLIKTLCASHCDRSGWGSISVGLGPFGPLSVSVYCYYPFCVFFFFFSVRICWKSIKRYSLVSSCTAVMAYSNTCMTHDVVNTDVFCICCTPNMNKPWVTVYQASVSRDSSTTNMAATANIKWFYDVSAKPQYIEHCYISTLQMGSCVCVYMCVCVLSS